MQLQLSVALLLVTTISSSFAAYTIYPQQYELTDSQHATFMRCLQSTLDENNPASRYAPICATDGFSYYNKQTMKCVSGVVPSVLFSFHGRCPTERVFMPMESIRNWWIIPEESRSSFRNCMDKCPNDFHPICGTDQKTYSSDCVMDCVTTVKSDVTKAGDGFCKQDMTVIGKCAPILQPFCGSDGVTYLNYCHLKFAMLNVQGLEPAHIGDCVDRLDVLKTADTRKEEENKGGCGGGCGCGACGK